MPNQQCQSTEGSRYESFTHRWIANSAVVSILSANCTSRRSVPHQLKVTAVHWPRNQTRPTTSITWIMHTLSSDGDRTSAAAGPRPWNSLPVQLRNPDITYGLFRWQLKGHLFREAWTRCSVTSDMWHHRKTLTYWHTPHTQSSFQCNSTDSVWWARKF